MQRSPPAAAAARWAAMAVSSVTCSGPPCDCSGAEPMLQVQLDGGVLCQQRFCCDAFAQPREPGLLVAGVAAFEQQRDALRRHAARQVAGLQLFMDPARKRVHRVLGGDWSVLALDVIEAIRGDVGHGAQASFQRLRCARLRRFDERGATQQACARVEAHGLLELVRQRLHVVFLRCHAQSHRGLAFELEALEREFERQRAGIALQGQHASARGRPTCPAPPLPARP